MSVQRTTQRLDRHSPAQSCGRLLPERCFILKPQTVLKMGFFQNLKRRYENVIDSIGATETETGDETRVIGRPWWIGET
jgi:hypothetical protein